MIESSQGFPYKRVLKISYFRIKCKQNVDPHPLQTTFIPLKLFLILILILKYDNRDINLTENKIFELSIFFQNIDFFVTRGSP